MVRTTLMGGQQIYCHPPENCQGHPCGVHNPSNHHMREWPQNWREDTQKMERQCPHGIGHPDPDDLAYQKRVNSRNSHGIHGCDGCCARKTK